MLRRPCSVCGSVDIPKIKRRAMRNGVWVEQIATYCIMCEKEKRAEKYYRDHELTLKIKRAWQEKNKKKLEQQRIDNAKESML